jgi:hypothetical protein
MRSQWKTAVLLLAAASLCLGQSVPQSAPAQPPQEATPGAPAATAHGPRRTLEGQAELRRLTMALRLNPDQLEKLRPIITDEGDQLSAVRLNEQLTPDQKKAKQKEIREAFNPKVNAILTPEQQEKWKKMQEPASAPAQPATTGAAPKQ